MENPKEEQLYAWVGATEEEARDAYNASQERSYNEEDLAKAYDLGVEQSIKRAGVYSRAICDWDELKEQFKKK